MVVIRLARFGAKHNPQYRVTVADQRRWVKGKFIETIGSFDPGSGGKKKRLVLDIEKAKSWIAKGAQPSERVQKLIRAAEAGTI